MQVEQLAKHSLAVSALFALCGVASLTGCAKPATVANDWPAADRATTLPSPLPPNRTLVAEYDQPGTGHKVYCVPYDEGAKNRYCSDQVANFDFVKNPLVVPIVASNPARNPFMQP